MSGNLDRFIQREESREKHDAARRQEKGTMSTTEEKTESIELIIQHQPSVALLDPKKKEELYAFLEREIEAFEPDLSTETSRKKIAALAYKVARTKTAIDEAGAELKAEALKKSQIIDASRREIREKLDALKEKARKPLTDWETAEQSRQEQCAAMIERLKLAPRLLATDTSATAAELLAAVELAEITQPFFQDLFDTANALKDAAITSLRTSVEALKKKESDAIELESLRVAQAAREKADREAAEAAELAQRRKEADEREQLRQQELAEAARLAEEKRVEIEKQKIAQAAKDAEEKTRRESEAKAKAESDRVAAEHQAELDKERRRREEAEEKQRIEAKRIADEKAAADKKRAEDEKLEKNKKHRQAVMAAAKVALMEHAGVTEDVAVKVVKAIVADRIPAMSLRFTI